MSSWTPTNYKTKNWSHYNRALKQRVWLSIWFDTEMVSGLTRLQTALTIYGAASVTDTSRT